MLGSQQPRLKSVPPYRTTAGDEAIAICELAGLHLDQWQQDWLRDAMGESPEWQCRDCIYRAPAGERGECPTHPETPLIHPWTAPIVAGICPRQNGKTATLAARELAGLFVLGERNIIHSAHLQKTASAQFRFVLELIKRTPDLAELMDRPNYGKGSEAIYLKSGQTISFSTRTAGGVRGESIDLIILDEAFHLPESVIASMVPTTSARPSIQIWYTSSAVDKQKHEHGVALARQREMGLAGKPGICFLEWSIEGDDPARVPKDVAEDPAMWAQANPGFNIRLTEEAIRREFDGQLGPREFAVERLGVGDWPSADPDVLRVVTVQAWQALFNEGSKMANSDGVLAFDVSPDLSWGSIAGAGYTDDGKVHVGIIDHEQRYSWIAPRIAELYRLLRPSLVICDAGSQAASVLPELERLNIPVKVTSSKEYAQACSLYAEAVQNKTISHLGDASLLTAIDGADTKPLSDAWKWDRRKSGEISSLVAATLSHWGVITNTIGEGVWSMTDIYEKIRREDAAKADNETPESDPISPEFVQPPVPEPGKVVFIPLSQMPLRR